MAIYTKTAKQMLVDLINEGNPNLPFPINDTDFDFTLPETIIDPGNGHNTRIRVIAKPNTNYIGNIVVTYRRLNVGFLFRNMTLEVQKWVANSGQGSGSLILLSNLLPIYSEKYGIPFTAGEWTDQWLTGFHGIRGDTFTIAPTANNLVFVGSVTGRWRVGERTLESLLPVDVVAGRLYPGGNNQDDPMRKYWITPDGFNTDYSNKSAILNGWLGNANHPLGQWQDSGVSALHTRLINEVFPMVIPRNGPRITATSYVGRAALTNGTSFNGNDPTTGYLVKELGMTGARTNRYILPHAAVPEANSEFFNRVLVLTLPDDCPWGTGALYFHYNV